MADYVLLMHGDARTYDEGSWEPYLRKLGERQVFEGGSAIGAGFCVRKTGIAPPVTAHIVGYIRVTAASSDEVRELVSGNPHFEAGGTVEIRELPRSDSQ